MKICSTCHNKKSLNDFHKSKQSKDGHKPKCKECTSMYYKTIDGLLNRIYFNQRHTSIKRNMTTPLYSKYDFIEWAKNNKMFHELYLKWVANNYNKDDIPSFDRIDDYKTYSFENIRVVTLKENIDKSYIDAKSNKNAKRNKPVQQSKDGVIINTFHSICEAERVTKIKKASISMCCRGITSHGGGFKWHFKHLVL